MEDLRRVEILRNGQWQEVDFGFIKAGDIFRMFEATGEPVVDNNGNRLFIAISNPYKTKEGLWVVKIELKEEKNE